MINLQTISVVLLTLGVLAFAVVVVAWLGLDQSMARGLGVGLLAGAALTLLSGRSLKRALAHTSKNALMVHVFGGFALRLALLVLGFMALAASEAASPVGFAIAFLAGTVLALFRQVMVFGVARGPVVAAKA